MSTFQSVCLSQDSVHILRGLTQWKCPTWNWAELQKTPLWGLLQTLAKEMVLACEEPCVGQVTRPIPFSRTGLELVQCLS